MLASPKALWDNSLLLIKDNVSEQQYNTWFRPIVFESYKPSTKTLLVQVPSPFVYEYLEQNYVGLLSKVLHRNFGDGIRLTYRVVTDKEHRLTQDVEADPADIDEAERKRLAQQPQTQANPVEPQQPEDIDTQLDPKLTFNNYMEGDSNKLPRSVGLSIAEHPNTTQFNPMFIYGGAGLGKTHLIHAIGNTIMAENPEKVVRYVHAEDYYSDVVRAYQQKSFDTFKRMYRSLDVLLLDDVQFFNGKNRSQEEFFFLFNALIEARKQIIITCDTYPKDINGLDDRLVTRFDWGLTVQIEPPELEMRVAILKKKAEAEGIQLDDEVAFFIAKHLRSNVRELEGALKKVLAYSSFHGRAIALDLAKEALKDVIGSVRNVGIDNIQKTVADYYKIKVADLFSKKRTRAIARPRQVAMWLCREVTSHSFPEIGDAFGGRDHTTVIHAVKTIDSLRSKENELNHDLHVLLQVLKG